MKILQEDSRQQLINKSKAGAEYRGDKSKGKNRYERRTHSHISSSVREYNKIDMNKLFKDDVLDFHIKVNGETDDYLVRLSFEGVVANIKNQIKKAGGKFDFRVVVKALIDCFNKNDVYIFCSCPDFHYRIGYWASVNNIIVGDKETRPSNITNPNDTWGPACKHICLVLQNMTWVYKVAAAINNYVNYMESHYKKAYAGIIYPALYGTSSNEPGKLRPDETMGSDSELIDKANEYGADRGKFKKGNTQGVRFSKETGEPMLDDEDVLNEPEGEEGEEKQSFFQRLKNFFGGVKDKAKDKLGMSDKGRSDNLINDLSVKKW